MAGKYDHLIGELAPGDKGWLPLDEAGKPIGPATKLPPAAGSGVKACAVRATYPEEKKDALVTAAGAPITDHNEAQADFRYYPPGSPTSPAPPVQMNNPVLNAINPSSAKASAGAISINVNGSSFYPESKVSFGGNLLTPTYVNSGQLQISVNGSSYSVGSFLVHVDNAGSLSISKTFTFTAGVEYDESDSQENTIRHRSDR